MKHTTSLWQRLLCTVLAILMISMTLTNFVFAEEEQPPVEPAGATVSQTPEESDGTTEPEPETLKGHAGTATFELMSTAIYSLTAEAYQLKVSGTGATSLDQVTDAQWVSTSNSGVQFYYTTIAGAGSLYSNNPFSGMSALPSDMGTVYYSYIFCPLFDFGSALPLLIVRLNTFLCCLYIYSAFNMLFGRF